ncbi:hypothetical protein T06_10045 [Trichinella sp. T6]|nr:hypothetical protein T06_10045 [Trichinella sp. T6]
MFQLIEKLFTFLTKKFIDFSFSDLYYKSFKWGTFFPVQIMHMQMKESLHVRKSHQKENKIPLLITEFIVIFMITTYFHTESLTA